ncbi:ScbR family autoregulator-binding transcription factor [Streptomyces sp. NPDC002054]|uniref:ScbR family autoregulator-binding transcription factor n=1 Tax=Streptomyces sp. NPDC002054 TaxID=3154663 RepID=UPI00332D5F70
MAVLTQLKQGRAQRTREVLLRAAAEVFDENGFSGASINKILERAGVTAGAVYFHFESKEGLARAVILEQAGDLHFPPGPGGLRHLVDMTLYLASEMQHNVLLRAGVKLAVEQGESGLQEFAIHEWWIETFRQELIVAQQRGELLPGVDEAEFARILVAAYTGTQIMSRISDEHADLTERITVMWRYLLPGVATPAVCAELEQAVRRTENRT